METLPKYTQKNQQERIGVFTVGLILTELGFIFREFSNSDVGIDGVIEYVNSAGQATGKIAAVQIKSGDSYLYGGETDNNNWTFYPEDKHKKYWEIYAIPVILLVYSPSRDKVYFIDVRHYFKINGLGNVKIPKENILDTTTKSKVFETVGNSDESFLDIKSVFNIMVESHCKSPSFNLSYLDLFLQGLTNICQQVYFDMSVAMDIVECRSPFIAGGDKEYNFIYEYVRFLVKQNLAEIDFGECLIEWNDRKLVPRFLAALTHRGKALLAQVKYVENKYSEIMPETTLVQERLIQLVFDSYAGLRIKKSQEIQKKYRMELQNKNAST